MVIEKKIYNNKIYYYNNNHLINDEDTLNQINKIYIPPAYTDVKIYLDRNLIATGRNTKDRLQYIYSNEFIKKRSRQKYCNIIRYAIHKDTINKDIIKNIKKKTVDKDKLIGIILTIMKICNFRIGNKDNEKKYQSTGLTTLRKKHIKINGDNLIFDFIGKKGVQNQCIVDKNIYPEVFNIFKNQYKNILKMNDYIFQFKSNNKLIIINESDVNSYLKKFNKNITSKDIRTWSANIIFINSLVNIDKIIPNKKYKVDTPIQIERKLKRDINNALKITSLHLHNTPSVCKKSYILPEIISLYSQNNQNFTKLKERYKNNSEKILLKILSTLKC
jgi:DNA topoisomerase-1